MKIITTIFLALIIAVAVTFPVLADTTIKSIVYKIGVPNYVVNNQTPGIPMDISPFLLNDRIYVPVRFLCEALGITNDNITWDESSQTATLKGANTTLQMTIDQAQVTINGNIGEIDVAPLLIQDRIFLPARYIDEGLGYQVAWDEKNQVVICWPQGQQEPDVNGAINWLNGPTKQSAAWTDITGNGVILQPTAIAVDSSGNMYVADQYNGKIKKLLNGTWTDITYNGGFRDPTGVAVDSSGNVYVAEYGNGKVKKLASGSSSWTDITSNGVFSGPCGVAVDNSGNLYVTNRCTVPDEIPIYKIKKLVSGSRTWTDITGNEGFEGLWGIAVDNSDNIYVTEFENFGGKIKKLSNGTWTDITGNGDFLGPRGVSVDSSGNLYVVDSNNQKIKKLANGSSTWTDITGNGSFNCPYGIAVDCYGNVYVADLLNGKIKKMTQ